MSSAIYPSLKGKRVVITGGGSGIGAGLTAGFVRQGAEVIFLDIVDEDSKALVASSRRGYPAGLQALRPDGPGRDQGHLRRDRRRRRAGQQRRQ
jgi:NAD(P)-dependent dehydrogenase (short-subunit alcohol dehydrogenase family)